MCINESIISDTVGLYFFSAVFQGNMALIALSGVFTIFKVQQLNNEIQNIENIVKSYVRNSFSSSYDHSRLMQEPALNYKDISELPNKLEELYEKEKSNRSGIAKKAKEIKNDKENFIPRLKEYEELIQNKYAITSRMKKPFMLTLLVILLAIIFLPSVYFLHNNFILWEIISILTIIFINIWALIENSIFIFSVLKK